MADTINQPSSSAEVKGIRFVPWDELKELASTDAIGEIAEEVASALRDLQQEITEKEGELRGIERFGNQDSRRIPIRILLGGLVRNKGALQEYLGKLRKRHQELEKTELERRYQKKVS